MPAGTTIIVGNLDGVHRGHQQLLVAAREKAGADGRIVVLSFDPHPLTVLRPAQAPARLTTFPQRRQALLDAGADTVVRLQPTPEFLALTPEAFIQELVVEYQPTSFVEGPDFHFGHKRAGNIDTLRALGKRFGFETIMIEPVEVTLLDQSVVRASSSILRWLLHNGRVGDAMQVLGRPYELVATVEQGDQRGRTIGFPTANLDHGDSLLPADGIYAGVGCRKDGPPGSSGSSGSSRSWPAAISVGRKPTFGVHPRICEAHLVGYDGPLDDYGWTIHLTFERWLRDQVAYSDVDALIEQIRRDVARAAQCFPPSTTMA